MTMWSLRLAGEVGAEPEGAPSRQTGRKKSSRGSEREKGRRCAAERPCRRLPLLALSTGFGIVSPLLLPLPDADQGWFGLGPNTLSTRLLGVVPARGGNAGSAGSAGDAADAGSSVAQGRSMGTQ
ncbi:uncharacterized protein PAN0_015c5051 [Moesziomyces antarcticus]|uniref:Uncharacterized protein n=2 Tax=Pseudozyma antarctica TaxID=84753 RepID=A0A5C3FTV7_PSEA2|nr:uncharacterized protein PAN0_015c5051 [Moesziomyces antarcticus]GAK66827.1 hypothetical protein PAN0_015c5051 [Moesziomyces antarcticus]SPO47878.1 uncharacterized protein PSANT_05566 [Moesziomyces antarcticus]